MLHSGVEHKFGFMHASSSVCLLCLFACMLACMLVDPTFICLSMHDMYCRLSKMCTSASAISSLEILQGSLITRRPEPAKILQRLSGSKKVECCKHAAKPWTTRFVMQGRLRSCFSSHAQHLAQLESIPAKVVGQEKVRSSCCQYIA